MCAGSNHNDAWLIVAVYNEEQVIGQVVESARNLFPNIVCVDDGSSDNSAAIAAASGAKVIRHPFNIGQGAALQTGIEYVLKYTDGTYLVTFDADGQHRPEDAAAMISQAKTEDLAFVFGSRFLGPENQVGWSKRLVLKTAAVVTRHRTGLNLTDAHNGLRVIRRDAASQLLLRQDRMAHASEIVGQLARTRLPWAERAVEIQYTEYSKAKGQSLLNSVNILVDLVMG